ncbi:MAG: flippase-like domain-containing protein [Solirubrobacterales bacterium]|nr:flippase-like domain-containing protein [Solirubrobacterales bacterium]MBV9943557.1 flippase-like domain-containing protein [Solirubrobacterales bacterium]
MTSASASAETRQAEPIPVIDQAAVTKDTPLEASDATPVSDVSAHRLRRGVIRLGGIVAVAVIIVTLAPGLGDLRERFAHAGPIWIAIGCALEVLSVLAYVPAFRAVFCRRMAWSTSYKIAVAEEGAGSLFPLGGAGSLALGVWALRRGGMPGAEIARKTVAFFLLTSLFPVGILLLLGLGLAVGVLPGGGPIALTALPAAVAAAAIIATIALGRFARRAQIRIRQRNPGSRLARLAPALIATADGVDEALHQLRQLDPLLLLRLFGFLAFDIFAFWASFRAVGLSPALPVIAIGYLIGQLGNWIPIPGGIAGTELGLISVLILFGLPAVPVTAAVLLYRVIELWVPALLGLTAFVQLRLLLRRETEAIQLCEPGDNIDIVALDPTTMQHTRQTAY